MAEKITMGQQLGNYRVSRLLGEGGFAQVFLGEHVYLNTQAAIKVLSMQLGSAEVEWFLREARTVARLAHPNIVRVLDFGVENGLPFLVLDYAPNGSLRQVYPRGISLPLPTIVSYVSQVADALQYAHDEKVVHRDVKPENMLLGRRNEVLLSDFGLALMAQSSQKGLEELAGTVAYIAPEQIQGKPRPASDQYSLGIVAYEWLAGERPFQGSFSEVISQHLTAAPPSLREKQPELAPAVEQVVLRALEKDPTRRFASIAEFAQALAEVAQFSAAASGQLAPLIGQRKVVEGEAQTAFPIREEATNLPPPLSVAPADASPTPEKLEQPVPAGTVHCIYRGHSAPVRALAWSPDGRQIISVSGEKSIHIWDAMTGENLRLYQDIADSVSFAGWSADGRYIATAGNDAQVRVWDFTSNLLVGVYNGHSSSVITALVWSPTEPVLATADNNGTVHVWEAQSARRARAVYRGHTASVSGLGWSPDGQSLISGSEDGSVQVWDATTGKRLSIYGSQDQEQNQGQNGQLAKVVVSSVAWSPEALGSLLGQPPQPGKSGSRIACSHADGLIQIWEVATGREVLSYRYSAPVRALSWSPDARRFAFGSDDATVLVWDTITNLKLSTFTHTAPVQVLSWSPDSRYLASGGGDNTIQVWVAP